MNEELLERVKQLIEHHETWSKRNITYTQRSFWVAVLSSIFASFVVGVDALPKVVIAALAGLPAVMLLLDKMLRYRDRALWHEQYATKLHCLYDEFMIAELSISDIDEQLSKLRADMNGCWPGNNISAIPLAPETNS